MVYSSAYETALADIERFEVVAKITEALDSLGRLLPVERDAYANLSHEALVYLDGHAHQGTLGAQQEYCERGPGTTVLALQGLAAWRCTDEGQLARITAEKIEVQLQDAITSIEDMHGSNNEIRKVGSRKGPLGVLGTHLYR